MFVKVFEVNEEALSNLGKAIKKRNEKDETGINVKPYLIMNSATQAVLQIQYDDGVFIDNSIPDGIVDVR